MSTNNIDNDTEDNTYRKKRSLESQQGAGTLNEHGRMWVSENIPLWGRTVS